MQAHRPSTEAWYWTARWRFLGVHRVPALATQQYSGKKKGILGSGFVIWVITGFGVGKPQGQLFMEHWLWGQALITCLALFYGSSARLMMVTSSG